MKTTQICILAAACLALPAGTREDPGKAAQRLYYSQERIAASGYVAGAGELHFLVQRDVDQGVSRTQLWAWAYADGRANLDLYCDIPDESLSIRGDEATVALDLPGPGARCGALFPAPLRLDLTFAAVPGESEESHSNGEVAMWGIQYHSQGRGTHWDARMSGTLGPFTVEELPGALYTDETWRMVKSR